MEQRPCTKRAPLPSWRCVSRTAPRVRVAQNPAGVERARCPAGRTPSWRRRPPPPRRTRAPGSGTTAALRRLPRLQSSCSSGQVSAAARHKHFLSSLHVSYWWPVSGTDQSSFSESTITETRHGILDRLLIIITALSDHDFAKSIIFRQLYCRHRDFIRYVTAIPINTPTPVDGRLLVGECY